MKLRTRITLWYSAILVVSLGIIGLGTYDEISEQMSHSHRQHVWEHALDETGEMMLDVGLPAVLLGMAGGWWITRKAFKPLRQLTGTIEQIHDHNLHTRLPCSGNGDELDRLTEVFNAMTGRLDNSFQRIREFTLHASHELKTPLTIMRGELEGALNERHLTPARQEQILSQMDEIERLAKIVDGLTLLTRADAGQIQLVREPVPLDELVRESFADAKILAQPHSIQVNLETCEPVTVTGDRHRLRQLLLNLTDNAIKHNEPGGKVTIDLRKDGAFAELIIANTGAGIAPELQPRVFERFFRATSGPKAVDGCGLGLSIAQWIVSAHRATIRLESAPGKLTTFSVRLAAVTAG